MLELLTTLPLWAKAAILGIVEGLTEFLPISSTGHLILASSLLGWNDEKSKLFDVVIQSGAIFAILLYFRERIMNVLSGLFYDRKSQKFAINVIIATIPAVVLGFSFSKMIKSYLFKPVPVAIAFIVGGIIILIVEKWFSNRRQRPRVATMDDLSTMDAVKVGLAQCAALVPGTSRSGATIIGGLCFGLSRKAATEFSFFLAIPILFGSSLYEGYKERALLSAADLPMFAIGMAFSFVSALLCVHWLIRFVSTNTFVPFAIYRIVFGTIILVTSYTGLLNWQ